MSWNFDAGDALKAICIAMVLSVAFDNQTFGVPVSAAAAAIPPLSQSPDVVDGASAVGTHYSDATGINTSNIDKLGLAWEFDGFAVRGMTHRAMEASPIVVDGVMYVTGPWSVVYALDAKTGRLIWQYDPQVQGPYARRSCCDAVNRGVAVKDGVVYVGTLDGYLIAINAKTGKPVWKADTFIDRSKSYSSTGAPEIAGPNVIIGNSGAEMGVRGYATAYNRKTGKMAWRFFAVPGDPAKGDESPDITLARKTWSSNSRWDLGGGGTPWDSMVYDPETKLVLLGMGNGMPHSVWQRSPGKNAARYDNLYLSSIVAVDAVTGRMKWYYQITPHDSWDYTATQNMILADLKIGGRVRKVVMQAPKNGFFYVIDRLTGKLISAEKYSIVTWADRVDQKTGRPIFTSQSDFSKAPKLIWPGEVGAHNWQPMAFNPRSGLVYIPTLEQPQVFHILDNFPTPPYSVVQGTRVPRPPYAPGDLSYFQGQPAPRGLQGGGQTVLKAWDPVANREVWAAKPTSFFGGGVLTTASGLVIEGTSAGMLSIYDGRSGKLLRAINIGTGIGASPLLYDIGGVDYIAFTAGLGGSYGHPFPPGSAGLTRENYERLIVLKLGGGPVRLPPLRAPLKHIAAPAKYRRPAAIVARGAVLFGQVCARCHGGPDTVGEYPNLWAIGPEIHNAFDDIVYGGALKYSGMDSFSDALSKKDVEAIHAYLAEPLH